MLANKKDCKGESTEAQYKHIHCVRWVEDIPQESSAETAQKVLRVNVPLCPGGAL